MIVLQKNRTPLYKIVVLMMFQGSFESIRTNNAGVVPGGDLPRRDL
jgi:hypothetical protein